MANDYEGEIERLKAEYERLHAHDLTTVKECARLHEEIERLRACLAIQYGLQPGGDLAKGAEIAKAEAVAAERAAFALEAAAAIAAERERCVQVLKWFATDDGRLMQNDISPIVAAIRKGE